MSKFESASLTIAQQDLCQDRVAVLESDERMVIVVADGAGGISGGGNAAATVVKEVQNRWSSTVGAAGWESVLRELDFQIVDGETTAVIVDLNDQGICGASVGDSQAWILHDENIVNLTLHQNRKPLLGSGDAVPIGFEHALLTGTLLVATDGFCNYVKPVKLFQILPHAWFPTLPKELADIVRLPSGGLWDDVGIVVCRPKPAMRNRVKRYVID